jgi:hypothetical protein
MANLERAAKGLSVFPHRRFNDTLAAQGELVMEHRWGQRIAVMMPVGLDGRPHAGSSMRDVSASGAFIETVPLASIYSLLHVTFMVDGSPYTAPAYVVRVCAEGVGVEWCTFAPQGIRALLEPAKSAQHGAYGNA